MNRIRSRINTFHYYGNFGAGIMRSTIPMNAVDQDILQCRGIYFMCTVSDPYEAVYVYELDGKAVGLVAQNIPWSTSYEYQ